MNVFEKLLEIQRAIDAFYKDEENKTDRYKYTSSEVVVKSIREKMNELGLILKPEIVSGKVLEGATKTGTTRYFTELEMVMTWVNADDPKDIDVCKWYAQGVDLAGEKGVGKAVTYAEKYFMLKYFHIPTSKDDPDNDGSTQGKKDKKDTQQTKETALDCRIWSAKMIAEICGNDEGKIKTAIQHYTKLKDKNGNIVDGKDSFDDVSDLAMPIVYAQIKAEYKKRFGKDFEK